MKKAFVIFLAVALMLPLGMTTAFAAYTEANVSVNGAAVAYPDQKPYNDSEVSRVFVPIRATLNAFGYDDENILWDQETQTVTTTDEEAGITTEIDLINNTWKIMQSDHTWEGKLDVNARLENNRTMVPIRTFSETYFKKVGWAQESQTVLIDDVFTDETVAALDETEVNELTKDQFVKVLVSSDGTYKWNFETEDSIIFVGENEEGVGGISLYFNAIQLTREDEEAVLTLTAEAVEEGAVLPEAKEIKYVVKADGEEQPAQPDQTDETTGSGMEMANPRTEYNTSEELTEAFGLNPFILETEPEGLTNTSYAMISGGGISVAEVAYTTDKGKITLRCAQGEMDAEITGVNGVEEFKGVEGLNPALQCGEVDGENGVIRVAYAYVDFLGMTFSVVCDDGCSEDAFRALLESIPEFGL